MSDKAMVTYTAEQVGLIKRTICKGASDDELRLFLGQCQRTGLDPFSRQIHAVMRSEKDDAGNWSQKLTIQVGIDGLRLVAARTGEYEGQTAPQWCGQDGVWRDVWLDSEPPAAARVGVYRKGFREPAYGVALYRVFAQYTKAGGLTSFWKRMPDLMLCKCAESMALRRAFPMELSGLYTPEETGEEHTPHLARSERPPLPARVERPALAHAPESVPEQAEPEPLDPAEVCSREELQRIISMAGETNTSLAKIAEFFGVETVDDLPRAAYPAVIARLEKKPRKTAKV